MEGAITISKKLPALKSMQYDELRQLGIQHIQKLAGKLWTDYNSHDPGITMLEILSYAITELGYRVNYDIKDLLMQDPSDPNIKDLQNFFTACEIFPNCALTFNDYRKLMMDVEVIEKEDIYIDGVLTEQTTYSGVKNAWINCVKDDGEKEIFIDQRNSKLSLQPIPNLNKQESYFVKTLYDVLLEFDKNDKYGDLNENKLSVAFEPMIGELDTADLQALLGIRFQISIEFPRWDEDIDWNDSTIIKSNIKYGHLNINHSVNSNDFPWIIDVTDSDNINIKEEDGTDLIAPLLETALNDQVDNLTILYQKKVQKIQEVICAVKAKLNANRNLCDDFFRFHALKIEEIILCTDIELAADADVEEVEAEILLAVSDFLAPKVYFYTIDEMRNKCRNAHRYPIALVNKNRRIFTISEALIEDLNNDDIITVEGIPAAGEYTVKCISPNNEIANHFNIEVFEEILSENIELDAALFKGVVKEETCLTVDQIFEGPKLKHGFIPDEELAKADRKKYIHVSDLIRIIMDVEGVVAVKNIQIANRPLDNDSNIKSRSVKWCLELAVQENYVPRLNIEDSILTFFKGQLPFVGKKEETYRRFDELEKNQRPQKIRYPQLDIPVPLGEYKDIEDYVSIQEHFPLFYGVGEEGIPGLGSMTPEQRTAREASVHQHKGFLMFFDQLLANFMSQLGHVNELFSMNGDMNQFGEYEIDKSYFGQPIYDVVPNAHDLYVAQATHDVALKEMVESVELFEPRRKKFLDHLMGRFAETFSDYALLTYKVSGSKANKELIEDKLQFLKKYPLLSAARGKGMDYRKPCDIWSVENVSGLEMRASLLLGIEEKSAAELNFSPNFIINETAGVFTFSIEDGSGNTLLQNAEDFNSEEDVKAMLESVIVNGVCEDNFKITENAPNDFIFELCCGEKTLALSHQNYSIISDVNTAILNSVNTLLGEMENNSESNRKNLACSISRYFEWDDPTPPADAEDTDPPAKEFYFEIYDLPKDNPNRSIIFSGTIKREDKGDLTNDEFAKKHIWEILTYLCDKNKYIFKNDSNGNYRFFLCDPTGVEDTIGESGKIDMVGEVIPEADNSFDFNEKLGDELNYVKNNSLFSNLNKVTISTPNLSSTTYESLFVLNNVTENKVTVNLPSVLPSAFNNIPFSEIQLSFQNAFDIDSFNLTDRYFILDEEKSLLENFLFPPHQIEISDNSGFSKIYSILRLEDHIVGSKTKVFVQEPIPDLDFSTGFWASYHKTFQVHSVAGNAITLYGKQEEIALQKFIDFIKNKFFSHEGMHLIEHHLLRPRYCGKIKDPDTGSDPKYPTAKVQFSYEFSILGFDETNQGIIVHGDNSILNYIDASSIMIDKKFTISDDAFLAVEFTLTSINIGSNNTITHLKSNDFDWVNLPSLQLDPLKKRKVIFSENAGIIDIDESNRLITFSVNKSLVNNFKEGDSVALNNSLIPSNNRSFVIGKIKNDLLNSQVWRITFKPDQLLDIHLDQDCENCQITDPYSCVATVILPYWAGRFQNMDVRNFVEKTLRTEAPAHVFLNICWVNCEHMEAFEKAYRNWLLEKSKKTPDPAKENETLQYLIEALNNARTVYPKGTLHSCDDDDTFKGSVILNNTALGSF